MEAQIQTSVLTVLNAIVKVFAIIGLGYWLKRRRAISDKTIDELARIMITAVIPCFLFVRVYREFSLAKIVHTYQMTLFAIALTLLAVILATITAYILRLEQNRRNSFIALTTFNNSGYLPIPLVYALLEKRTADEAAYYIAIFILFTSPLLWSWGVWLLSRRTAGRGNIFKIIFTPPAIGIVAGMICAVIYPPAGSAEAMVLNQCSPLLQTLAFILNMVVSAAYLLGEATVPLAMIIIGTILASIELSKSIETVNLAALVFIKLILMPLIVLVFLRLVSLPPVMELVMLIQAAVPPGGNLAIIARNYGGDSAFVSTAQLITYIVTIFTLPCFLSLC